MLREFVLLAIRSSVAYRLSQVPGAGPTSPPTPALARAMSVPRPAPV